MASYVHFHALDRSLSSVVILVDVASHLLIASRLFAIIKSFQHSCVGTCLRQKEIILENSIAILSRLLLVMEFSWSIILEVLHEA